MSQPPRRDRTRIPLPPALRPGPYSPPALPTHSLPLGSAHPTDHRRTLAATSFPRNSPRKRVVRKRGADEAMLNSAVASARQKARARAASSCPGGAAKEGSPGENKVGRRPDAHHMYRSTGSGAVQDASDSRNRVASANPVRIVGLDQPMLFHDGLAGLDSPGGYNRLRSSADSDAGSSSCKDMDEPEVFAPDSIQALIGQLRKLIYYVESKPALAHGSASFMRDYLRTMLLQNSVMTQEVIAAAAKAHKKDVISGRKQPAEHFKSIPEEL
eukprot:IDg9008t1